MAGDALPLSEGGLMPSRAQNGPRSESCGLLVRIRIENVQKPNRVAKRKLRTRKPGRLSFHGTLALAGLAARGGGGDAFQQAL